jgi:hypothetical protein
MDAEDKRRSGVRAGTEPAPTGDTNTVLLLLWNLACIIHDNFYFTRYDYPQ